jgi:hypothetical protein
MPPSGSSSRPSPTSPHWPTTWAAATATTPPAPRAWPVAARARTQPTWGQKSTPAFGDRPSPGCGPT